MTPKDRYHIIGVVGEAEQGKTTFMVRHILREMQSRKIYKAAHMNIHTKGIPHTDYIYKLKDIKALRAPSPQGVPQEILGLDQIHKYANARRSSSDRNVQFNDIIIESRQHGFDLIFTTWGMKIVDPNVRKYVDLWVLAEKKRDGFHYTYAFTDNPSGFPERVLSEEAASEIWKHFDTTELVKEVEAE